MGSPDDGETLGGVMNKLKLKFDEHPASMALAFLAVVFLLAAVLVGSYSFVYAGYISGFAAAMIAMFFDL